MKKQICFGLALVLTGAAALAADYTWKSDAENFWDFTNEKNFDPEGKPASGDSIRIPGGVTVVLNRALYPAAFVAATNVTLIREISASRSNPAVLEITVAEGETDLLPFSMEAGHYSGSQWGMRIVKKGPGIARFTGTVKSTMYNNHHIVEEGVLSVPTYYLGTVEPRAPGIFDALNGGNAYEVLGDGVITNSTPSQQSLMLSRGPSTNFTGVITGLLKLPIYSGQTTMMCPSNAFTGTIEFWDPGYLEFMRFGGDGNPSSLGLSGKIITCNAGDYVFRYIGKGPDVMSRQISLGRTGSFAIDGGLSGGLTVQSTIDRYNYDNQYTHRFVLDGVNADAPCVLKSALPDAWKKDPDKHAYSMLLVKRGTGTWRLTDANRNFSNGLILEGGILETEAINPAGTNGALGWGTNLTHDVTAIWEDWHRAPYAISFASTNAANPGILAHVGTKAVNVTNRPAVVKGCGGFRNDGSRPFVFAGVSAFSNDVPRHVFVLTGTNEDESEVRDLTDALAGTGNLSVEKTGSGLWMLAGTNLTFSGGLDVKEGTLLVSNPDRYRLFRFAPTQTWGGYRGHTTACSRYWLVDQIYTYDADGKRTNYGLAGVTNGYLSTVGLKAGEGSNARAGGYDYDRFYALFNDKSFLATSGSTSIAYDPDDPETWRPIDFKLPYTTAKTASWGYAVDRTSANPTNADGTVINSYQDSIPRIACLQASLDGITWKTLNVHTNAGSTGWQKMIQPAAPIDTTAPCLDADKVLPNVEYVRVAPGAKIVAEGPVALKNYRIDAGGAGTLEGIVFPEDGALSVTGVDPTLAEVTLNGTYANVTGLENLPGWEVTVTSADNKDISSRYTLSLKNGQLTLTKKGLVLIVR